MSDKSTMFVCGYTYSYNGSKSTYLWETQVSWFFMRSGNGYNDITVW